MLINEDVFGIRKQDLLMILEKESYGNSLNQFWN
jgi:hypothetical protein